MRREHPYDEADVLKLLVEGNEFAFGVIYDRYRPKIYHLALKFLKSAELAEEVVQEVFLKIWLRRTDLVDIKNFESYLFVSAKNTTVDAFRKLSNKAAAESEYAASHTIVEDKIDYPMMDEYYSKMVNQTVALLPPQQAKVFQLARIEGLSQEAIAQQMNISKLTVKKHMANALQFMRQLLQHHLAIVLPFLLAIVDA